MAETVGALPANVDLVLYGGDDFWMDVHVTDSAGVPVDLTGWTPRAQVRAMPTSPVILVEFDITSVDNSTMKLYLASADTRRLPPASAWDLMLTDAADAVLTLVYGKVSTTAEVTR